MESGVTVGCHIDALQGPGGHVSVNIHYQNPWKMWDVDLTDEFMELLWGETGAVLSHKDREPYRRNDFLIASEEGQAIRTGQTLSAPLSYTV